MCKHDFNFYVPFYVLMSFYGFLYFYLFVVDEGVSLAPTYSSIVIKKSDLRSSLWTKRLVKLFFYPFLQGMFLLNERSFKALDLSTIFRFFLRREKTLRRWTIDDLFIFARGNKVTCWFLAFFRNLCLTNKSGKDHFRAFGPLKKKLF